MNVTLRSFLPLTYPFDAGEHVTTYKRSSQLYSDEMQWQLLDQLNKLLETQQVAEENYAPPIKLMEY